MTRGLLERLFKTPALAALRQENLRLRAELDSVKERHVRHLDEIAGIQRQLLPGDDNGGIEDIRYAASYRPFFNVGGDYYDIVPLPAGPGGLPGKTPWGAIIADASGHGPAAAVEIAMMDAILRTYTGLDTGPAAALNYINRHFFTRRIRKDFITAMVINFDPDSGLLTYANAGHHPALILGNRNRKVRVLNDNPGIPLGVTRGYEWSDTRIPAASGDTIFLYTDGIIESRSVSGEYFGRDRLESIISGCQSEPEEIIANVTSAVDRFRRDAARTDDESMLAISIL